MAAPTSAVPFHTPYPTTPGASMPGPWTTPQEGTHELWAFFWLSLVNTAIIGVAGVATWLLVHPG